MLSFGCTLWTGIAPEVGIRPNAPKIPYSDSVLTQCEQIGLRGAFGCLEYFSTVEWGQGLSEAYRSRATFNRQALTFAGILAAAVGGASAGFAVLDEADSDAAKLIPIIGTFTAAAFALFDNKELAQAYTKAANSIDVALKKSREGLDARVDRTFLTASFHLFKAITEAKKVLEGRRASLPEAPS